MSWYKILEIATSKMIILFSLLSGVLAVIINLLEQTGVINITFLTPIFPLYVACLFSLLTTQGAKLCPEFIRRHKTKDVFIREFGKLEDEKKYVKDNRGDYALPEMENPSISDELAKSNTLLRIFLTSIYYISIVAFFTAIIFNFRLVLIAAFS